MQGTVEAEGQSKVNLGLPIETAKGDSRFASIDGLGLPIQSNPRFAIDN